MNSPVLKTTESTNNITEEMEIKHGDSQMKTHTYYID